MRSVSSWFQRLVSGEASWTPNVVTYGYSSRAARFTSPPSVPASTTRDSIPRTGILTLLRAQSLCREETRVENVVPVTQMTHEDEGSGKVPCRPPIQKVSGRLGFYSVGDDVTSVTRNCDEPHGEERNRGEGAFRRRSLWSISVGRGDIKPNCGILLSPAGKVRPRFLSQSMQHPICRLVR